MTDLRVGHFFIIRRIGNVANIPKIQSAHNSEARNIINALIERFNSMGYTYDQAMAMAQDVLDEAQQVNAQNADTNERLDNIIADSGTSSTEVVDARGTHTVLSGRLNENDESTKDNTDRLHGKEHRRPLDKGIITFTLDNSYASTYDTVYPEFKARGLKFAVSPVASSFAGTQSSSAYYDYKELKEMADYGVEVIAHGLDGLDLRKSGTALPTAQYEIEESKRYWQKIGFKSAGYCALSSLVHADYKSFLKVFDYAFSEYWSERPIADSVIDETTDLYAMGRHSLYTDYTNGGVQVIKDAIDYVEQNKVSLHYYNHEVNTGSGDSIPLTVLQEVLDYAQSKDIEILLPTEAIQRHTTKLIAGENISNIRKELDDHINVTHDNLFSNSAYQGSTVVPLKWEDRDTSVGGVTKTLIDNQQYQEIKYDFDTTDNVGNYVGLGQRVYTKSDNKPGIATISVEVESDSVEADIVINMAIQNASNSNLSYVSERIQLSEGKKVYSASALIPKSGVESIAANFAFYPRSATVMSITHSKPKMERSRSRTPWFAPVENVIPEEDVNEDTLEVTRINDNNPTPDVTGIRYATLGNTSPTTITNFVTSEYNHELNLIFANSNTVITGTGFIRLKDGQNFEGNVGDVLTLIKTSNLSSAWHEKSRSKRTV